MLRSKSFVLHVIRDDMVEGKSGLQFATPITLILAWLLLASLAQADEPKLTDVERSAKQSIAIRLLVQSLSKEKFTLTDEQASIDVKEFLRAQYQAGRTHERPASDQLKEQRQVRFDSRIEQLIGKAVKGLGKEEELKTWLTRQLDENAKTPKGSLRQQARTRFYELGARNDGPVVDKAVNLLIAEQSGELREKLQFHFEKKDSLTPSEIVTAAKNKASETQLIEQIRKAVVDAVAEDTRKTLLKDSDESLKSTIDSAIGQLVSNCRTQVDALGQDVLTVSPTGILNELTDRLETLGRTQDAAASSTKPVRIPSFGVFPAARESLPGAVQTRFEKIIAAQVARLSTDLTKVEFLAKLDERQNMRDRRQSIQTEIQSNRPLHHRLDKSLAWFQKDKHATWQADDQVLVIEALAQDVRKSASPHEVKSDDNLKQLATQARAALDQSSGGKPSVWAPVHGQLAKRYDAWVTQVRQGLADKQADELAHELMSDSWTPTESEIRLHGSKSPTPEELRSLSVKFSVKPEDVSQWLEETWTRLTDAATTSLKVGREAMTAQEALLDAKTTNLEAWLTPQIARTDNHGRRHWINLSETHVGEQWTAGPPSSSHLRRYPKLFASTQAHITAVVDRALDAQVAEVQMDFARQHEPNVRQRIRSALTASETITHSTVVEEWALWTEQRWTEWRAANLGFAEERRDLSDASKLHHNVTEFIGDRSRTLLDLESQRQKVLQVIAGKDHPAPTSTAAAKQGIQQQTASPNATASPKDADLDSFIDLAAIVLVQQNRIVDRQAPGFKDRLEKNELDARTCEQELLAATDAEWKSSPEFAKVTVPAWRELLPSVKERIHGLVADWQRAASQRADVLALQTQMAKDQSLDFLAHIRASRLTKPDADLFAIKLVETQWQADERPEVVTLRQGDREFQKLLSEVENQIKGIVDELFVELAKMPIPEESMETQSQRVTINPSTVVQREPTPSTTNENKDRTARLLGDGIKQGDDGKETDGKLGPGGKKGKKVPGEGEGGGPEKGGDGNGGWWMLLSWLLLLLLFLILAWNLYTVRKYRRVWELLKQCDLKPDELIARLEKTVHESAKSKSDVSAKDQVVADLTPLYR